MESLTTPLRLGLAQLTDPPMLRVLGLTTLLSGAIFALLALAVGAAIDHALAAHGTLAWLAGGLGGIAALITSVWLFLPLAAAIGGLFTDAVCAAVEARYYPGLPPANPASLAAQLYDGLAFGLRTAILSVIGLILALFLPGVGFLIGLILNAYALSRSFHVAAAMRHMRRPQAIATYETQRSAAMVQGVLLALIATVPLANLLIPILGPAVMVHVLHARLRR